MRLEKEELVSFFVGFYVEDYKGHFPSSHHQAMELGLNCQAGMLSLSPLFFVPAR